MPAYQPKIRKFSGDENPMRWLKDYMAEIDGPGGPGLNLKQVHISTCLEGPALDWYNNDLESRAKISWPLFPRAFIIRWKPVTFDIRAVEVLNLTPPVNICQPMTAHMPPTVANTTLNWATNIDESIGPVPRASDFRPTAPLQLVCAPTELTVTPSNGDAATETVPVEPTPAILPLIEPNSGDVACTPSPDGIALAGTALTESAPINPAPTTPILLYNRITTTHVDAFVNTPTVYAIPAHPPRDLSGLKSGARNPWGSINHRRRRFHPPRDHPFSPAERLQSLPNSYSNLHPRNPISHSHSYSHLRPRLGLHFQPHSPAQLQPTVHKF